MRSENEENEKNQCCNPPNPIFFFRQKASERRYKFHNATI
jgi:hypothetical protein